MSILTAGGITPVKGTQDQVLNAIRALSVGIIGSARNVKMSVTAASVSAAISADQIFVGTSLSGQVYRLASFSKTINLATTGAGGMDTGTAPVSGYVAIYAIYNPTTATSALLAVNATATRQPEVYGGANMPSGFTASALVNVWRTNASGQFIVGNLLPGRRVNFTTVASLSSSSMVTVAPLSITSAVPPNAISCRGDMGGTSSAGSSISVLVFSDSAACGRQFTSGGPVTGMSSSFEVELLTPQTIFYTASSSTGTPNFTINVSSYRF
jgi:hypothetical protein